MNTSAEAADRIQEEQQRKYERNYTPVLPDLADYPTLKAILNDEELAMPLSWLMDAFEVAMEERDKLDPTLSRSPGLGMMLRAAAAIQRQLLEYAEKDPVMVRIERE